jgi:2,4-dienoyl-CoA reductase-like NADH-dependent reductase (Old Yellow Enzyme family)
LDVTRQQHVAYHETGHAITANQLGIGVDWIERNDNGSGLCWTSKGWEAAPDFDRAVVFAAGALAVWLKFGIRAEPSLTDLRAVQRLPRGEMAKATDRAEQILRDRWADVEALATRLLADPDGFVPLPFAPDYSNL